MDFIVVISATRTHLSGLLTEFFNAVAVKLDFVEPFFAIGDVLNGEGMHWLDEIDSGGVSSSCFHLSMSLRLYTAISKRGRGGPLAVLDAFPP